MGIRFSSIFMCVLLSVFLLACSTANKKDKGRQEASPETSREDKITLITKEINTKTGRTFVISEYKKSASLSDITVIGKDFPARNELIKLTDSDPLEDIILVDLDKNGFEELYLITRSVGSGSYAKITGITSNRDKSYGMIYIPETGTADNTLLKGYMGHDKIYLENGNLVREFPVYKEGDANSNPTGGTRKIMYTLKAGEASYILEASLMQNSK